MADLFSQAAGWLHSVAAAAHIHHGLNALKAIQFPKSASFKEMHGFWTSVPQPLYFTGFCLYVATVAPELRGNFLLHFWGTFLAGFAGGPLSALLIMDPERAPINILGTNRFGVTFIACWWLMTYSPLKLHERVADTRTFKTVTRACVAACRAFTIIGRVNLALKLFPGILMAPILLAVIAASGGSFTFSALRYVYGLTAKPVELTVPGYSFRSAFLGTCIYLFFGKLPSTAFMEAEAAAGLLITLFVAHNVISDLTDWSFDWSEVLLGAILKLANIPMPKDVPQPLPEEVVAIAKHRKEQQQRQEAAVQQRAKQQQQQQQQRAMGQSRGKQHQHQQRAAAEDPASHKASANGQTSPGSIAAAAAAAAAGKVKDSGKANGQSHASGDRKQQTAAGSAASKQQQQQANGKGHASKSSESKKRR